MSFARLTLVGVAAAIALAACGAATKPTAGTPGVATAAGTRGRVDDPRTHLPNHVACLRQHNLHVALIGLTDLQIGAPPGGPFVHFTATAGEAQGTQISGQAQGAEVIGSALLYPNQGSDGELSVIEACLAQGVNG
jgi:hypothetical protein